MQKFSFGIQLRVDFISIYPIVYYSSSLKSDA